ncbi:NUDIX domain-containing protein [Streptomyces sp. MMS21 TC-5]|uniref:NUDIX domain-containing protein n=1 Tax=Streptomyces sp. MMS21 TC-5 TaxID=2925833 RepID=UPI001F61A579|nr:NUDIX domain-containing protein [Streptomyces sp. MMS21 TC-5]MCI4078776.1 NUDIX domain-containing protein [Streptomyces sp. MMS21 TC-5]
MQTVQPNGSRDWDGTACSAVGRQPSGWSIVAGCAAGVRRLGSGLARPREPAGGGCDPGEEPTRAIVRELVEEAGFAADTLPVKVAWSPEVLRESFAVKDTFRPDRLVFGSNTTHSGAEVQLRPASGKIIESGTPAIVTGRATAEHAKGTEPRKERCQPGRLQTNPGASRPRAKISCVLGYPHARDAGSPY